MIHIHKIICKKISEEIGKMDCSFFSGISGLLLFYSLCNKRIESQIMDMMYNKIVDADKIGMTVSMNGWIGIGIAIEKSLSVSDSQTIDYVLSDVDAIIFKASDIVEPYHRENIHTLISSLFYFTQRIKDTKIDDNKKEIYTRQTIYLVNFIYSHLDNVFWKEQLVFHFFQYKYLFMYCMIELFKIGIHRKKITHIYNEIIYYLFCNFPVMHYNRLQLLYMVTIIMENITGLSYKWKELQELLIHNISQKQIEKTEFKSRQILFSNGYAGCSWLMNECNKHLERQVFQVSYRCLLNKILNSNIFNDIRRNDGYYVFNLTDMALSAHVLGLLKREVYE